ncbi:MAG: hypothetical protein JXR88_00125 [Clostridia bacterium]|nr:hypothetical protein [Clostridia bacterium]
MPDSQAVQSLKTFYNRLISMRQLNQDQKVAVSIRHGMNQLNALKKGLGDLLQEENGFKMTFDQMISETKVKLENLLVKQGSLQLAFFGDDVKSPLIQEILNIDFPCPDFCDTYRYQFKGISPEKIDIQLDSEQVISSEEFYPYLEQQAAYYEHEKKLLTEQWEAFQKNFDDEPGFLKKVEEDYRKRLEEWNFKCDAFKMYINREWLVTYSFIDIKKEMDPVELSYLYDGLIYVFDNKKLYYQKDLKVIEALKLKPGLAIVTTDNNTDLTVDVQRQFENQFKKVMMLNLNQVEVSDIIHALDEMFDANYEQIKLTSKRMSFERNLKVFKNETKSLTQHLIQTYNQLALLRSELKTNIEKEHHQLRSKVLWVINNYEMQVKLALEEQLKEYTSEKTRTFQDFLKDIMFKDKFEKDLEKLKNNLRKMVLRFYEKNRADYEEDYNYFDPLSHEERNYKEVIELKNHVLFEVTDIYEQLNQYNNKMIFTRRKKINQLQEDILVYLEKTTEAVKKLFFDEIQLNITTMHQTLYQNFEHAFEKKYCKMDDVNRIVRFVDDEVKKISTTLKELTLRDIILTK